MPTGFHAMAMKIALRNSDGRPLDWREFASGLFFVLLAAVVK